MSASRTSTYTAVCRLDDLDPETGVAALVGGEAVAVFRTYDGEVLALGNYDPFSRASVLARGIVGTRDGRPFVASPMHKQAFDLRTGQCLDDETVRVPTYEVRIDDGEVLVGEVLAGDMPAGEVPAGEVPAGEVPAGGAER